MKQNQYVRLHSERWQFFEDLCEDLDETLPVDFPANHRRICSDLALSRSRHYSPALVAKLNNLVRLGQNRLYQGEGVSFRSIMSIYKTAFPQSMYENRIYIWIALAAFWGLALISYTLVIYNPDALYYFMGTDSVKDIENMYDPSGSVQTRTREMEDNIVMFGVYIYNNIGIAFQMFAAGALICIGAIIPLLFNSFYFGAISAHIVNIGYQETFFSFVVTHGSFELNAIVIAGAAGCKIGWSILNPGEFTRGYAIKAAGKSVRQRLTAARFFLRLLLHSLA